MNEIPLKFEIISTVLKEDRDWIECSSGKVPNLNEQVVMRLYDPNKVFRKENDPNIYAAEDVKIGIYIKEENKWLISPPYMKYDFSELSSYCNLKEGVIITHWAYPLEEELKLWASKENISGTYTEFEFKIDKDHEEIAYSAVSSAIASILITKYDSWEIVYQILSDLHSSLNSSSHNREEMNRAEEYYRSKIKEYSV
jgi:hypothetical protein